ncbi:MAG: GHKL domain-containing protein [Candidatus Omnitrophica bacterium]|nr:GHKL domain-containing protein [Candidatus Omnitrophota bacterium]
MNLFAIAGLSCAFFCLILSFIALIFGKAKIHRILAFFNIAVAVWGFGLFMVGIAFNEKQAIFGWKYAHIGGMFVSVLFFHLVCSFCEINRRSLLLFGYFQAFVFNWISWFPDKLITNTRYAYGLYYNDTTFFFLLAALSYVILVIASFIELFNFLKKAIGNKRLQAKYLIFSFFVGFLGGTSTFLPEFRIDLFYPAGAFGVALYAITGTYVILRYRLLDLNVAFTRAGIFGVVYALVLGVPFWLGYKYNQWQYSTWIMLILATSGPFIYSYLRRHAEDIILKDQRRYQQALRELAETMTHIRSLDALIQIITTTMVNAVKVNFAAMYVKEEESNSYVLKSCNPQDVQDKFPENLAVDSAFVKFISAEQRLVTCDEIKHKPDILLECGLFIPCFMENDLLAFIALGTKPNSQMFTTDDILVFETVSYSASLAIENCRFWREIEDKQRKARLQEMDTYSYSLAHEIDNPVHIILNETTLIKDYLLKNITNPQEYKEAESACGFTIEAARRVAGMVKAIRDFGSPVTGKALALKIDDVVESFFKLYYPQFKDKAIVFEKTFSGDLGFIRGIKPELMQVLVILANNSIHAMREAELKKITLKVEPVNHDRIRIIFSDTGYGIKKENLEIIFLPFTTTKASSEGTGMGLYNAKKIIERHKGKISAQSDGKGQGACFVIELPKALDVTEEEFIREGQKEKRLI